MNVQKIQPMMRMKNCGDNTQDKNLLHSCPIAKVTGAPITCLHATFSIFAESSGNSDALIGDPVVSENFSIVFGDLRNQSFLEAYEDQAHIILAGIRAAPHTDSI